MNAKQLLDKYESTEGRQGSIERLAHTLRDIANAEVRGELGENPAKPMAVIHEFDQRYNVKWTEPQAINEVRREASAGE